MTQSVRIEESWYKLLQSEFEKPYFNDLKITLKELKKKKTVIFPPGPLIFNAFNSTPLSDVKVVILGQDPYHRRGQAMGMSFAVPRGVAIPPSLKNIYKEIHRDVGAHIPNHGDLSIWTNQGVLLLNSYLTVEEGKPGSHKSLGWQYFTDAVISQLSAHQDCVAFLLWGNFAKSKSKLIDANKHLILSAAHPSPLAGNKFSGCAHFSKTNNWLNSKGMTPIDWEIQ